MRRVQTKPSDRPDMAHLPVPPPYVANPELELNTTEQALFAGWDETAVPPGRLRPDEEALLFKRLHFSAYRLSWMYQDAARAGEMPAPESAAYWRWLERYNRIRELLVEANVGLVFDMIGRSRFTSLDIDEMRSEGMMALLRAVDTFDPWRGFRFSTYACNAILRAFSRAALRESKRRRLAMVSFEPGFEKADFADVRHEDETELYRERLRRILDDEDSDLTPLERTVLEKRFPGRDDERRETLETIGRHINVSKERVRQIQLSALSKLRKSLTGDAVLK